MNGQSGSEPWLQKRMDGWTDSGSEPCLQQRMAGWTEWQWTLSATKDGWMNRPSGSEPYLQQRMDGWIEWQWTLSATNNGWTNSRSQSCSACCMRAYVWVQATLWVWGCLCFNVSVSLCFVWLCMCSKCITMQLIFVQKRPSWFLCKHLCIPCFCLIKS